MLKPTGLFKLRQFCEEHFMESVYLSHRETTNVAQWDKGKRSWPGIIVHKLLFYELLDHHCAMIWLGGSAE